jgi:hypothetical protein
MRLKVLASIGRRVLVVNWAKNGGDCRLRGVLRGFYVDVICALIIAVMVMAARVVAGLIVAPPYGTDEQHSQPIQNGSGVLAVSCWLGFEFNSTLGYPGEGPPVGTDAPLEMEVWLQQVEEQKRLIEALPVVKRLDFFYDDADQNLNKVVLRPRCGAVGVARSSNGSKRRATRVRS